MIFNEEEIREYGREKKILFPLKKPAEKQGPDNSFALMLAIRGVFDLATDIAKSIKKGFNAIDSRFDDLIKYSKSAPVEEKKADKWEFRIKRDISNNIIKIEARRM